MWFHDWDKRDDAEKDPIVVSQFYLQVFLVGNMDLECYVRNKQLGIPDSTGIKTSNIPALAFLAEAHRICKVARVP